MKLFSGHFYGQSFIKTVRGPLICLPLSVGHAHFQFYVCWVVFFFLPKLLKTFCEQALNILIEHGIMRCLVWVCNVFLYPLKRR